MSEFIWAIPSRTDPPDPKYLMAVQHAKGTKRTRDNEAEAEAVEVFGGHAAKQPKEPYTPSRRAKKRLALAEEEPISEEDMDLEPDGGREADAIIGETAVTKMLESVVAVLPSYSDHAVWSEHTMQLVWAIAHKFHLIQPAKERTNEADSKNRDQEIAEITRTLGALTEEFKSLRARIDEKPRMTGEPVSQPPVHSKATTVLATGPVYRPTKAQPSQPPKPTQPKSLYHAPQPKNPMQSHHQSRLIVIARGEELDQSRLNPRLIVTSINDALAGEEASRHLRVASAHYNHRRNLIIMTREDQKGADLLKHANTFLHVFNAAPGSLELMTDERRYKVRIDGVWTGSPGTVHTPDELRSELEQCNPVISTVNLTSPPKWIRSSEDLKSQEHSSIVLELGSEDDAVKVLGHQYFALFSKWCKAVKHADRPPVLQCQNCWAFGHHAARCRVEARCRICTEHHDEGKHAEDDADMNDTDNIPTTKCVNCGGNHPATDRLCPERVRLTGIAREKETKRGATGGGRVRQRGGGTRTEEKRPTESQEGRGEEDGFTLVKKRGRGRREASQENRENNDNGTTDESPPNEN